MRRPAAVSLTAATATTHMLLRPTHSRIIMPAAITGRDSTARFGRLVQPRREVDFPNLSSTAPRREHPSCDSNPCGCCASLPSLVPIPLASEVGCDSEASFNRAFQARVRYSARKIQRPIQAIARGARSGWRQRANAHSLRDRVKGIKSYSRGDLCGAIPDPPVPVYQ